MAGSPDNGYRDRPVGELVGELAEQTSTLVRKEIALARAEMTEKGRVLGTGAGEIGAGGVLALFAFGALTTGLILLLDKAIAAWLAAVLVAIVYAGAAAVLGLRGKQRIDEATPPIPEQTAETLKEDVAWVKTQAKSART
jgi:Putative Actinobacterial Holin-X, holin superfamily III